MKMQLIRNNNLFPSLRSFDSLFERCMDPGNCGETGTDSGFMPALNLRLEKDEFILTAEIPGVNPDDVDITLDQDVLTLSGEKKWDEESDEKKYYRIESRFGSFVRKVKLPKDVDHEAIKATCQNGILEVRLKKSASAQPRSIPIQS